MLSPQAATVLGLTVAGLQLPGCRVRAVTVVLAHPDNGNVLPRGRPGREA